MQGEPVKDTHNLILKVDVYEVITLERLLTYSNVFKSVMVTDQDTAILHEYLPDEIAI